MDVASVDYAWTITAPCGSNIVQVYISYAYLETASKEITTYTDGDSPTDNLSWSGIGTNSITVTEINSSVMSCLKCRN